MEINLSEKTIKKQKTTIIVLSVILAICIISLLISISYYTTKEKEMNITLKNYYNTSGSLYTCYEITIFCNINKIIEVKDFTFKHNNENICVSKIKYDSTEYETNESFIIYPQKENVLTLYISLTNDKSTTIYYKFTPIELYKTIIIK